MDCRGRERRLPYLAVRQVLSGMLPLTFCNNLSPSLTYLKHIQPTAILDVLIIEQADFGDDRDFFYKSFNQRRFAERTGVSLDFVQDDYSKFAKAVLRGLHYQIQ